MKAAYIWYKFAEALDILLHSTRNSHTSKKQEGDENLTHTVQFTTGVFQKEYEQHFENYVSLMKAAYIWYC